MEHKRVFIGNLDFSATEDELQSLVSRYGTIISITLNQKKGFAFIEMESAEDAGKVLQALDGIKHRKREIRLSLEMKVSKARSISARQYKERGATLARQKSENCNSSEEQRPQGRPDSPGRTARDDNRNGAARGPKIELGFKPRERSTTSATRPYSREQTGSARPAKRPWTTEKPSYPGRPVRDGERPGAARGPKPESGYKPRERSTTSETRPLRPFSRERTGPPRPARKTWSTDKPSYSGRPVRDGQGPGSSRPPKKEWSSQGHVRPSVKTGENRGDRPERKSPFSPKPRDYSKPRSTGGPQNRFSKPSRPGAAVGRSSYGPSKPKPGGNYAGRGKPPRRD